MKALSIKQPWASLIAHGIKDIENRTWKTNFRGRIFIHSTSKISYYKDMSIVQLHHIEKTNPQLLKQILGRDLVVSAIIGEVDIVDCVINHPSIWAEKSNLGEVVFRDMKPTYNWVLANPVLYDKPILNVKGSLSLWDWKGCEHLNITRSDGLDECLDCGTKNY